jgi:hypothetical protein
MRNTKKLPPALKHAGCSAMALLPGESPDEFEKLPRDLIAEFAPAGALEDEIVATPALLVWRKQNLASFQIAKDAQQHYNNIRREKGADWTIEPIPGFKIPDFETGRADRAGCTASAPFGSNKCSTRATSDRDRRRKQYDHSGYGTRRENLKYFNQRVYYILATGMLQLLESILGPDNNTPPTTAGRCWPTFSSLRCSAGQASASFSTDHASLPALSCSAPFPVRPVFSLPAPRSCTPLLASAGSA